MSGVFEVCPKCRKTYQLGVNGAYNEKRHRNECDQCAGVKRDAQGHAWSRGESHHYYGDGDGPTVRVSRRQAMAGVNKQ